jgi:hypothetical protein
MFEKLFRLSGLIVLSKLAVPQRAVQAGNQLNMADTKVPDSSLPASDLNEKDLESGKALSDYKSATDDPNRHGSVTPVYEIARARHLQNAIAPLRYLGKGEEWLDRKMGIETQGIDRIPEEEKRPPSILNTFFMWWSMTCHVGKFLSFPLDSSPLKSSLCI